MGYEPTLEELMFIYNCLLQGMSDNEKILKLLSDYRTANPSISEDYRSDKRFVNARKREFQAAKEVLWGYLKQQADPPFAKAKQEHFNFLADVARILLSNGINAVSEIYDPEEGGTSPHYVVLSYVPEEDVGEELCLRGLCLRLKENLGLCYQKYGQSQVREYFIPHWQEETHIQDDNLEGLIEKTPMSLIENLKVFAQRGYYQGKCPICQDW